MRAMFSDFDRRSGDGGDRPHTLHRLVAAPAISAGGVSDPQYYLNAADRGGTGPNGKPSFTVAEAAAHITRDGYSWNAPGVTGTPVTVTYSFRSTAPATMPNGTGGFSRFSAAQITAAELALQSWSDVANVTFTRVGGAGYSNAGQIVYANYNTGASGAAAFAYLPNNGNGGSDDGDVWVNVGNGSADPQSNDFYYNADPKLLDYGRQVLAHETGHAIGLEHPGDYNAGQGNPTYADADYYEDTRQYSIMSYWDESNTGGDDGGYYSSAPLLDDIAAAQRLYGANMTTRTGDTVYGFNSTAGRDFYSIASATSPAVFAVWDAGGTDTLDFSGYAANQLIDLGQGNFSNVGGLVGNVSIAIGAVIENAIGGTGSDVIYGNAAGNTLDGHGGIDQLFGLDGNDRLIAGAGAAPAIAVTYATERDSLATAVSLDGGFSIVQSPDIGDSTTVPHATANAESNGAVEWYKVTIGAGQTATFDIDGASFDTRLYLYDASGNPVLDGGGNPVGNDDGASVDPGSTTTRDSFLTYTAAAAGTYYLQVRQYSYDTADNSTVTPDHGSYQLNVSVTGHSATGTAQGSTLDGGAGNDVLLSGTAGDTLTGGAGTDTASYETAGAGVTVSLAVTTAQATVGAGTDTLTGIENLFGSAYNDNLTGDGGNNYLRGLAGSDNITGGGGNDTLDGSGGYDRAIFADAANGVTVNLSLTGQQNTGWGMDSFVGVDAVLGSSYDDTLIGDAHNNELKGGIGNDTLVGGGGNDQLNGGAGTDTADYSGAGVGVHVDLSNAAAQNTQVGSDTLTSIENLLGGAFNDVLTGSSVANVLSGGAGIDKLDGGLGKDTLTGGAGNDKFYFTTTLGSANIDTITDFTAGQDKMFLDHNVFAGLTAGALAAGAYDTGAAASDADDRIIYNSATGALLFDRDGNGSAYAAVQFATLSTGLSLSASSFAVT